MKYSALILICIYLVGCDPYHPPVIANGYNQTIEISVSFNDGMPAHTGIRLAPQSGLMQHRKGLEIQEIRVSKPDGGLSIYRMADFETARSVRKVDFEVWILNEEGLKLGDKEDLRELHKGKR